MEADEPLEETLPAGSIIGICLTESDRIALDIPPGELAASVGCMAVLWNAFMAVFTIAMGLSFHNDLAEHYGMLIGLFWLIGAGLIFAWVKLRFERTLLFVDGEQAVLRSILFGRQKQVEAKLDEMSRAELTVSYCDEDQPVSRISIVGADGARIDFGTALAQHDKAWCVDAINTVLRRQDSTTD